MLDRLLFVGRLDKFDSQQRAVAFQIPYCRECLQVFALAHPNLPQYSSARVKSFPSFDSIAHIGKYRAGTWRDFLPLECFNLCCVVQRVLYFLKIKHRRME